MKKMDKYACSHEGDVLKEETDNKPEKRIRSFYLAKMYNQ